MIFRLVIVLAVIVLLIALAGAGYRLGRRAERSQQQRRAGWINPETYHELGNLVRALMSPPREIEDLIVIPDWMRDEADRLIKKIGAIPRSVR
jgi:hypothetical protein